MFDELKQFKEHVASWDNTPRCVRCNREATHEIKPSSMECDYQPHCSDCVDDELRTCQEVADHEMCHFGGAYGIPSLDVRAITRHEPQREKVDVEALKRECADTLSKIIPHSYSDNTMLNTIDYLHSRNLIRGAVKPIDGLDEALKDYDLNGQNLTYYTSIEVIFEAAKAYQAMIKAYEEGK